MYFIAINIVLQSSQSISHHSHWLEEIIQKKEIIKFPWNKFLDIKISMKLVPVKRISPQLGSGQKFTIVVFKSLFFLLGWFLFLVLDMLQSDRAASEHLTGKFIFWTLYRPSQNNKNKQIPSLEDSPSSKLSRWTQGRPNSHVMAIEPVFLDHQSCKHFQAQCNMPGAYCGISEETGPLHLFVGEPPIQVMLKHNTV